MSFFTCFVYLKKIYMLVWFMVFNATFKRVVRTTFDIYVFISTNQYWCFKHHKPNQPVDHFQINAPWYRWKFAELALNNNHSLKLTKQVKIDVTRDWFSIVTSYTSIEITTWFTADQSKCWLVTVVGTVIYNNPLLTSIAIRYNWLVPKRTVSYRK